MFYILYFMFYISRFIVNNCSLEITIRWLYAKKQNKKTIKLLIKQSIYHNLDVLRKKNIFEISFAFINRVFARMLNFLEKNRVQFKIFLNVQKNTIMTRYANFWIVLILFLIRLLVDEQCSILLIKYYLKQLFAINRLISNVETKTKSLFIINF